MSENARQILKDVINLSEDDLKLVGGGSDGYITPWTRSYPPGCGNSTDRRD